MVIIIFSAYVMHVASSRIAHIFLTISVKQQSQDGRMKFGGML
jgi:hypothetical protein